jgi:hypothetical protein
VAKRNRRGAGPDPGVLLAQLRSPDEQVRVTALHRICPRGAGVGVNERPACDLTRGRPGRAGAFGLQAADDQV